MMVQADHVLVDYVRQSLMDNYTARKQQLHSVSITATSPVSVSVVAVVQSDLLRRKLQATSRARCSWPEKVADRKLNFYLSVLHTAVNYVRGD